MILPCFRLELSSIPSHIRLFLVLNVIIKKTKKQLIPHYCLLPVLKTLPLSRFNVTLGSEIVNYHDALDLKSFRFCFLLDVHRVFLENHVWGPGEQRRNTGWRDASISENIDALSLALWGLHWETLFPTCVLPGTWVCPAPSGSSPQGAPCNKNCYSCL